MNKPEVTIIHHTAVGGDTPQFYAVNRYHKSLGFPRSSLGYYVGYHYMIGKNGNVVQARLHSDIGAHTIGWNDRSIGICLSGNFNVEQPPQAQLEALRALTEKIGLPVDLHRQRQVNRTCPGRLFTLELLQEPTDAVDNEKEKMIRMYLKRYPKLRTWLLMQLDKLRK
jgi:hypothetical protein